MDGRRQGASLTAVTPVALRHDTGKCCVGAVYKLSQPRLTRASSMWRVSCSLKTRMLA
jgi:hypothetical protein